MERKAKPEILMPTEMIRSGDLKKIYSLYLQGNPVESIQLYFQAKRGHHWTENQINQIIDDMNDTFL